MLRKREWCPNQCYSSFFLLERSDDLPNHRILNRQFFQFDLSLTPHFISHLVTPSNASEKAGLLSSDTKQPVVTAQNLTVTHVGAKMTDCALNQLCSLVACGCGAERTTPPGGGPLCPMSSLSTLLTPFPKHENQFVTCCPLFACSLCRPSAVFRWRMPSWAECSSWPTSYVSA